jgi:curved DNA-binding protein CbpA
MRETRDYYRILEVRRASTREEIRSSFRRLAKKYHPDTSPLDPGASHRRMFLLIEAYRVLGDDRKRARYDRIFTVRPERGVLTFRESLLRRSHETRARVLLVLYDLLGGRGEEAIESYEELRRETGAAPDPLTRLGPIDYLDCLFLLGEAYQRKGRFVEAVRRYEDALREDARRPCLGRLRPEVIQRIRDILCRDLARAAAPRQAIDYYLKLSRDIPVSRQDRAFCHKKIAEAYCELGDREQALSYLEEALRLHAKLGGMKKIREKLQGPG